VHRKLCDAADTIAMADDPPPPYTECEYDTKIDPALQPVSFKPQDRQTLPQPYPSAPASQLQTVAYYPVASSSGGASILLQPSAQQQTQVVVIQSPPVVVPSTQPPQSFTAHICVSCISCWLTCWACPCSVVAFILASKTAN